MVTCAPIACKHRVSDSVSLPSRGSFHLSLTVLFAIGHWVVFSLGGWSLLLHTGFHVSGATLDSLCWIRISRTGLLPSAVGLSRPLPLYEFQRFECPQPRRQVFGLGSSHFARRYFGNRGFFLFLRVLRCFSSPGFLYLCYGFAQE